jgi:hypothetical protein
MATPVGDDTRCLLSDANRNVDVCSAPIASFPGHSNVDIGARTDAVPRQDGYSHTHTSRWG